MFKKFPLDKINVTKNAPLFFRELQLIHSFTLNSQFLYDLKHKIHISKTVLWSFHFQFHLAFIKVYINFFNKKDELFDFETS